MIVYQSLESVTETELHRVFLDAFSDYQVSLQLSNTAFIEMLHRRSYDSRLSIGAFHEDKLIGFILVGVRKIGSDIVAYDTGTGVVPNYRRQSITSEMLQKLYRLLKDKKVSKFVLEVLQSNDAAYHAYVKSGCKVSKEYLCFKGTVKTPDKDVAYEMKQIENLDTQEMSTFWDNDPSWQNMHESIKNAKQYMKYIVVLHKKDIIAYAVVHKVNGDVLQLAVHKEYRNQGIATSLLNELNQLTKSSTLSFINIDSRCKSMISFLLASGFKETLKQYEMIYDF